MNNDRITQLIQNISLMTELWTITFSGFKRQGLNDIDCMLHTKAFMATIMETFVKNSTNEQEVK